MPDHHKVASRSIPKRDVEDYWNPRGNTWDLKRKPAPTPSTTYTHTNMLTQCEKLEVASSSSSRLSAKGIIKCLNFEAPSYDNDAVENIIITHIAAQEKGVNSNVEIMSPTDLSENDKIFNLGHEIKNELILNKSIRSRILISGVDTFVPKHWSDRLNQSEPQESLDFSKHKRICQLQNLLLEIAQNTYILKIEEADLKFRLDFFDVVGESLPQQEKSSEESKSQREDFDGMSNNTALLIDLEFD